MITRILTCDEDLNKVPLSAFTNVSIVFPDTAETTNAYNFKGFYPPSKTEDGTEQRQTLQLGFADLYELSNFAAEVQKAFNYALTRANERMMLMQAGAKERANAVPTSEADKS